MVYYGTTVAARVWNWVRIAWDGNLVRSTLSLIAELAFTLFLVALFLEPQGARAKNDRQARVVKVSALTAEIATALLLLSSVIRQIYATLQFDALRSESPWRVPATRGKFVLMNARSELSLWLFVGAVWIVSAGILRALKTPQRPEEL
jgi:hypothetical protein